MIILWTIYIFRDITLILIVNDENLCTKDLFLKRIRVLVRILFDICVSMAILGRWPWRQIAESTADPAAIIDRIVLSNQMSAKRKVRVRPSIHPSRYWLIASNVSISSTILTVCYLLCLRIIIRDITLVIFKIFFLRVLGILVVYARIYQQRIVSYSLFIW